MTISAKIIEDTQDPITNVRLTTFQLRYPRFIHAEFMTHRMLSRCASSSRAIPVARLVQDVMTDLTYPMHWGKNQPGMQAKEECNETVKLSVAGSPEDDFSRQDAWNEAREQAVRIAMAFDAAGYHKQIVNRLLEPFSHINVVVTATEWDNLFELRCHPDAQPEFQALAYQMQAALQTTTPRLLKEGGWHLPYITSEEKEVYQNDELACLSAARCARTSYLTYDLKEPNYDGDMKLFEKLAESKPEHASPLEHPAQATGDFKRYYNLTGFRSFRWLWDAAKPGAQQAKFVGMVA